VTQDRATPDNGANQTPYQTTYQQRVAESYYALLGIQPTASAQQVRQAYRDLSKLYHPDTTTLEAAEAILKFQQLNAAYATLSNPERRRVYDQKIGYSRVAVVQPLPSLKQIARTPAPSSAYLDPRDRPLSPGEIFAIFILGITVVGCLVLAIAIGITQGPAVLDPITAIIPQRNAPQSPAPWPPISPNSAAPPASLQNPVPQAAVPRAPQPVAPRTILPESLIPTRTSPNIASPTATAAPPLAPPPAISSLQPKPLIPSASTSPNSNPMAPKALNSIQVGQSSHVLDSESEQSGLRSVP
jgi:hypothetical protein